MDIEIFRSSRSVKDRHCDSCDKGLPIGQHRFICRCSTDEYELCLECGGRDPLSNEKHQDPSIQDQDVVDKDSSTYVINGGKYYQDITVSKATFGNEVSLHELVESQKQDTNLAVLHSILSRRKNSRDEELTDREQHALNSIRRPYQQLFRRNKIYINDQNVLLYKYKSNNKDYHRILLPKNLRNIILRHYHNDFIHNGRDKINEIVKQYFYWPGLVDDIQHYIKQCETCNFSSKNKLKKKVGKLKLFPSRRFNEIVCIDLVGPLPVTSSGNRYLLTIQDRFSRYLKICPISDTSSLTVAKTLINEWIFQLGLFDTLLSDQGVQFKSDLFKTISGILGYKHIFSSTYHPQTNGLLERSHR